MVSLGSWPPEIEIVNKYGMHALAAVFVPAVGLSLMAAQDKITDKEKEFLDRELEKRRKKLSEMCEFVSTHLKELAEKREAHKRKQEEAQAKEKEANAKETEDSTEKTKGLAEQEEVVDSDDLESKIRFGEIFDCATETEEIDEQNCDLGRGLVLSAELMKEELEKFTRKTEAGDPQYRDGSELENLVQDHERFMDATRKFHIESKDKEPLRENIAKLWVTVRASERVVKRIRNKDFIKAGRLVLLAKKALPFVGLSTAVSAGQGMLQAMEFLYRTQSLEIFRAPAWKWEDFFKVTKAVLWTRALSCALSILKVRVDAIGNEELGHIIRTEMYKALLRQDFEWYRLGQKDARNINEMFQSIFSVPSHVTRFIGTPMEIIQLATNILTQVAIIRKKSSRLLYAMMALYWVKFGCDRGMNWLSGWVARSFFGKVITPNHRIFMEPIDPQNLQTVRSFGAEEKAISMWNVFWKSIARIRRQNDILTASVTPLSQAISESTTMAEYAWAGKLINEGDLQVGEMETTMHFSNQVSAQLHGAGATVSNVNRTFAPLAKAWDIVSLKPTIGMEGGLIPEIKRAKGEIKFENVSFKYPTGNQILRQVTFTVPAGHVCGITGESGGGKSTIFKLIERFYDVKEGSIQLDGHDIRELNPVWLRTQISVVSQKPRFMSLPLRENLCYGCPKEPSTEEIESACKAAHIYDLVFSNKEKFPAGLYTYVAESTLSGGELQRLSIARAILMDAPILFLDEATSALDNEAQALVNAALKNLCKGRTVLSIAHRLEAIKDSDMIICLAAPREAEAEDTSPGAKVDKDISQKSLESQDEKKKDVARKGFTVVEQGTHAELFALGGVYAGLCNKQIESSAAAMSAIPETSPVDVQEEVPAQSAVSVACLNELRSMYNDLQAETLDELSQEAFAVRLQALIGRVERNEAEDENEDGADVAGNQGQEVKSSFRTAALKVISANRFKPDTLSEDDPSRYRSARSALLTRQCSSQMNVDRSSSVKAVN